MLRPVRWLVVFAFASAVGLLALGAAAAPRRAHVVVTPARALLDARFHIRATGLPPRAVLQLRVSEPALGGGTLTASKSVRADRRGVIDVPRSSLLGLVKPQRATGNRYSPMYPATVRVTVVKGRRTLASTTARRFVTASSITVEDERPDQTGLYGEYFRPASTRNHTAIVLIGGSEGGLSSGNQAGLLASHGYPVLELAYFSERGLPSELQRIPLEYFQHALQWFSTQPEVDPQRVVIIGGSRGGEGALLIGSTYPQLVRAVAAYVPSENVNGGLGAANVPAWTLGGAPVPLGPIAVEKIAGPVFAVGALDDHLWGSANAVVAIKRRLLGNGRRDFTGLVYQRAGHGVGLIVPNIPSLPSANTRYGVLNFGGTPADDQAAREDSWPKLLRFLSSL
jgi:dienelactone hydrolase